MRSGNVHAAFLCSQAVEIHGKRIVIDHNPNFQQVLLQEANPEVWSVSGSVDMRQLNLGFLSPPRMGSFGFVSGGLDPQSATFNSAIYTSNFLIDGGFFFR